MKNTIKTKSTFRHHDNREENAAQTTQILRTSYDCAVANRNVENFPKSHYKDRSRSINEFAE